jgi:hypothetical protein
VAFGVAGSGIGADRSYNDITQEGVTCELDHVVVFGWDDHGFVVQVANAGSIRQLDASSRDGEYFKCHRPIAYAWTPTQRCPWRAPLAPSPRRGVPCG